MSVDLGDRSYPICIEDGGLDGFGAVLTEVLGPTPRVVVVSDPVVSALYGTVLSESLEAAGVEVLVAEVPDGEAHKGLDTWRVLVRTLIGLGVDRQTPVIALGGGVTGDIVGFAAATVLRGLRWVQVPTTLLAMVDSAVGGKTGVNTEHGKNLVGAFHQPSLVYAAMATLSTLPPREIRCGLGEVLKHGVLADPEIVACLETSAPQVLAGDQEVLGTLVARCCEVKAAVVAEDEREAGRRAVLNLGHTVGHAIETVLLGTVGALPHGECVAMGLLAEARWAVSRGWCEPTVPDRIASVMDGLGMACSPPPVELDALVRAAGFDKKVHRGRLTTAIIEDIGRVRLDRIDIAEIPQLFSSISGSK